jgi:hypothetical protein
MAIHIAVVGRLGRQLKLLVDILWKIDAGMFSEDPLEGIHDGLPILGG